MKIMKRIFKILIASITILIVGFAVSLLLNIIFRLFPVMSLILLVALVVYAGYLFTKD